jgi:hypothetical protein
VTIDVRGAAGALAVLIAFAGVAVVPAAADEDAAVTAFVRVNQVG